jgi:hypothetical protein
MNITEAKKQAVCHLLTCLDEFEPMNEDDIDDDSEFCLATGLCFPESLNEVVYTKACPLWVGLWLGDEVKFDEEHWGKVPKWLAEAITESVGIEFSSDICE